MPSPLTTTPDFDGLMDDEEEDGHGHQGRHGQDQDSPEPSPSEPAAETDPKDWTLSQYQPDDEATEGEDNSAQTEDGGESEGPPSKDED